MKFINDSGKTINIAEMKVTLDKINDTLNLKVIDFKELPVMGKLLHQMSDEMKWLNKSGSNFSKNVQARVGVIDGYLTSTYNEYLFVCEKDACIMGPKNNDNILFLNRLKDKVDEAFDMNYADSLYQLPTDIKSDFHFFRLKCDDSFFGLGIDKENDANYEVLKELYKLVKTREHEMGIEQPFLKKDKVNDLEK